jgi:hypothetical protein
LANTWPLNDMNKLLRFFLAALFALISFCVASAHAQAAQKQRFVFGGSAAAGEVAVAADARYTAARGYGFEGAAAAFASVVVGPRAGQQALAPVQPLYFSVDLPEGSYRVTLTLGGVDTASDTTVRAELRRLVVQGAKTAPKQPCMCAAREFLPARAALKARCCCAARARPLLKAGIGTTG